MTKLKKDKKDIFTLKGIVEIIVKDKDGNIKHHFKEENTLTYRGLSTIIRLSFEGLTDTKFGYLAIGTSTVAEDPTQLTLGNELIRKPASITQETTINPDDTALLQAQFSKDDGLTGTANISEGGIFNASSGGCMLARKTFTPVSVNWDIGDIFIFKYYIVAKIVVE